MKEYIFLRVDWQRAEKIAAILNKYAENGWCVVSHTAQNDELTFVLAKQSNG